MKKVWTWSLLLALMLQLVTPALAVETAEELPVEGETLEQPFDLAYPEIFNQEDFPYELDSVLVKLAPGSSPELTPAMRSAGVEELEPLFDTENGRWVTARLSGNVLPPDALSALRQMDGVVTAEYNYIYQSDGTLGDQYQKTSISSKVNAQYQLTQNPQVESQWALLQCGVQQSWEWLLDKGKNPGGDASVVVAVIDTGVDHTHEDLVDNMWVNTDEIPGNGLDDDGNGYVDDYYGVDLVAGRGNGDDDHGHGTHVAGVIAADNNLKGIVGVAFNTKIMSVKAGQSSGYFNQATVAKAILYAYDNGADVINMSFGGSASSIAVQDALATAYTRCVLVASAGNDGMPNEGFFALPNYPAAYSYVLGVMSVDQNGVESSFTNYDVAAYNGVEYEVYAPGEGIISTIPGNRYATWSGTSMAAPLVSGMAALLRSYYTDPNSYPTKFIYGQLASTSEQQAACIDPKVHGLHNLPKIVNLYDAFTKLPTPELHISDHTYFDTTGMLGNGKNNGDGVIDAGEVLALGFEVRNRWGMSKDTVVKVDALSPAGTPCPYVQFSADGVNWSSSASVDYGSVGTYSTQDAGRVMDGEGTNAVWVGWENPLYVKVSPDCPNDYMVAVNVTITAKNALNDKDSSTYTTTGGIILEIRRGTVLPRIISEDMTLTPENYYIIENSTVIEEGATVTVEPGTKIQFWSDDPNDAYADQYIAMLTVKGSFITNGTEEAPVELFPSELMSQYRVEIQDKGTVELNGTKITNPYVNFDTAIGCEFTQNYEHYYYQYRGISNGKVVNSSDKGRISGDYAEDCAFYKLISFVSGNSVYSVNYSLRCIFVDCALDLQYYSYSYEDCVFYGNNTYWAQGYKYTSSYSARSAWSTPAVQNIVRNPENGSTYLQLSDSNISSTILERLAQTLGGHLACIETQSEYDFLKDHQLYGTIGLREDPVQHRNIWVNGAEVNESFVAPVGRAYWNAAYAGYYTLDSNGTFTNENVRKAIIEIPGEVRVENLILPDADVSIDMSGSYTLLPTVSPATATGLTLRYFSSNPNVATVDSAGHVTPAGTGDCTLYVFSEDMEIYTSMELHVKNEVKTAGLSMPEGVVQIDIGTSRSLRATLLPADSTKQITYTSDNTSVATVDYNGLVTAHRVGEATITATVDDAGSATGQPLTASTTVRVVVPVERIDFAESTVFMGLDSEMTVEDLHAVVTPDDATNKTLIWDSSNPEICRVENGMLIRESEGVATLKATAENTSLSATVTVCVAADFQASPVVEMAYSSYYGVFFALQTDGSLWIWGGGSLGSSATPKKLHLTDDKGADIHPVDMALYYEGEYLCVLDDEGNLYSSYLGNISMSLDRSGIKCLYGDSSGFNVFALTADGSLLAKGYNDGGSLGVSDTVVHHNWIDVNLSGKVTNIYAPSRYRTFFLNENGDLYKAGDSNDTPQVIAQNIEKLQGYYAIIGTRYMDLSDNNLSQGTLIHPTETYTYSGGIYSNYLYYYLDEGAVYVKGSNTYGKLGLGDTSYRDTYQQVTALADENVCRVWSLRDNTYFATADGKLYAAGSSSYNALGPASADGSSSLPVRIDLGLIYPDTAPTLRLEEDVVGNLHDVTVADSTYNGTLNETPLRLDFDTTLFKGGSFSSITLQDSAGNELGVSRSLDLNRLVFTRAAGFTNGETYTLTIPADAVRNGSGVSNQAITVTFYYCGHAYEISTTPPTCTEDGEVRYTCSVCGDVKSDALPAPGHDTIDVKGYPATCKTEGLSDGARCTVCGEMVIEQVPIPRTNDHDPETVEAVEATCTTAGLTEYTRCTVCGEVVDAPSVVLPAGHTYVGGTCTVCGKEIEIKNCSFSAEVTTKPTCAADGVMTYTLIDGTLEGELLSDEVFTEVIPALSHVETVAAQAVPATCTKTGLTAKTACVLCDETLQEATETEALGHAYDEPVTVEATCTEPGYTADVCTRCGDELITNTTEALGHDAATDAAVAPTHDLPGLTKGSHCGRCGEILVAQSVVPAQGHDYVVETVMPTVEADGYIDSSCTCGKTAHVVLPKLTVRDAFTQEMFDTAVSDFVSKGYNTTFWNNAILNRTIDDDVNKWLRITAPNNSTDTYGFGGNYWGTTSEQMIDLQVVDYTDFTSMGKINTGDYLTEAPETTFPFVVDAYLTTGGNRVTTVGNEEVTFVVKFNRDMDTSENLLVCFGSSYPYAEYEIPGDFTDARTWKGTTTLKTIIENGYQFWSIDGGRAAADENGRHLKHYKDWARFTFKIDTTSAMAMTMQGYADTTGVHLSWEQDDYSTLAGYNVYRAETETGTATKLNTSVILPDEDSTIAGKTTGSYTDTQVTPGQRYYYSFTVVPTDVGAEESQPSGRVSVVAMDTLAPSIIHTPVVSATTGSKVGISATVTDNVKVTQVTLYYRTTGVDNWSSVEMTPSNSKYSAYLPADAVTTAGLQYYIMATDGNSNAYAGNEDNPYSVTVQQGVESNAKGDVDGDNAITLRDALMMLRAIAGLETLTDEQLLRADLDGNGTLTITEALKVLQYVNGTIPSVLS